MLLWSRVADESASRCCTSATLDIKKVQSRFEHEGLSFLTITLPSFGKAFERSLDQGGVDPCLFTGFRFTAGLPRFLGGFLDLVFDRSSGMLLDVPSVDAILAVRQLTLMFGKMRTACSDARRQAAMLKYVECENDVVLCAQRRSEVEITDFRRVAQLLFARVFTAVDSDIYAGRTFPKHGPGATADHLVGNGKWDQNVWPARLESILPAGEMLLPSWSYYSDLESLDIVEPDAEVPVRVISVPKTLKTPRIIGIEPTAMQYAQQAVLDRLLVALHEEDNFVQGIIGIDDQTPNQRLAQEGSSHGSLATLDLSDASDRVSNQLVIEMMRNWPHLCKAVQASRSTNADVPGHGVMPLAKFASMGSALCFPVEAMVFTTCIFIGIERELGRPLLYRDVVALRHKVRVYGDDIIIPVEYVRSVVEVLQSFGAVVNLAKSFWTGKFRESCGREFYDGHDVSIVRVRADIVTQRRDAPSVISTVALRNQLYLAGYWQTCRWLDSVLTGVLRYYPVVLESSQVLGRVSFLGYETQGLHPTLHRPFVKGYVVSTKIPLSPLEGRGALLKWMLGRERAERSTSLYSDLPVTNADHLERSGRPKRVDIKLGQYAPY